VPIDAPFHGLKTKLYVKDPDDITKLALGNVSAAELVGDVSNIGDLELTRNIIEYNSYGQDFKRKLVGQADSGTLDITVSWVPDAITAPNQALLKTYFDSGADIDVAIIWEDPNAAQAGALFNGFIASFSVSQPTDDVVTANIQIAIDQGVTMDLDGTF
jgi:hypothetical protein